MPAITVTELAPPPTLKHFAISGVTAQDIQDIRNSLYAAASDGIHPKFAARCNRLLDLITWQKDDQAVIRGSYE